MKKTLCVLVSILCLFASMQVGFAEKRHNNIRWDIDVVQEATPPACSHDALQVYGAYATQVVSVSMAEHEIRKTLQARCVECGEMETTIILETELQEHQWQNAGDNCLGMLHEYSQQCAVCGVITTRTTVCGGIHDYQMNWRNASLGLRRALFAMK